MIEHKGKLAPEKVPALVKKHGSLKAVARAIGIDYRAVHGAYVKAVAAGLMKPLKATAPSGAGSGHPTTRTAGHTSNGRGASNRHGDKREAPLPKPAGWVKPLQAERRPLPAGKDVKHYLFTCAQNDTKMHDAFWRNLIAYKEHLAAELHVARFSYMKAYLGSRGDKAQVTGRGEAGRGRTMQWSPEIEPYLSDDRVAVTKGLTWCGEMNIIPTAERPLDGFEAYTGRASGIFPHVKRAMESIAADPGDATKFNYTTGTVTLRNYIQRKAGLKGEFHHCYGALHVEVNADGDWWCRQLNADQITGAFYDLDLKVEDGAVTSGHRLEAITWGDVHVEEMEDAIRDLQWGTPEQEGIIDRYRPKHQFLHDVWSFRARSHHRARDHHYKFKLHVEQTEDVREEATKVAAFLKIAARDWCKSVVVDSNHHRHATRWLNEEDGRRDPVNAEFWFALNQAVYEELRDGREPNVLAEAVRLSDVTTEEWEEIDASVKFLGGREGFVICHDAQGGIECGAHGDKGINGSKGAPRQFAKMSRKRNIGHFHWAGIIDGVYVAGTSAMLRPDWSSGGPSNWSNSLVVTYPNGKRAILTIWKGKERA